MRKILTELLATVSLGGPLKFSHNILFVNSPGISGRTGDIPTWRAFPLSTPVLLAVLLTILPLGPSPRFRRRADVEVYVRADVLRATRLRRAR